MNKFAVYSELSKNYKARELYDFLVANPELKFVEPYASGQSFNLGRNAYLYPSIIDIAPMRNAKSIDFIKGLVYSHSTHNSLTDFNDVFHKALNTLELTQAGRADALLYYITQVDFNHLTYPYLIEELPNFNNYQTEKIVKKILSKPIETAEKILSVLGINHVYPSYESTAVHHWVFLNCKAASGFPALFERLGYDINMVNSIGHTAILSLLTPTRLDSPNSILLKIQVALEFLDAFGSKIDVDQKIKGKTYIHHTIKLINQYAAIPACKAAMIQFFEQLLTLNPSTEVRSGVKSRGSNIITYIERYVADKDLGLALKDKIVLEKISLAPKSSKSFKL